MPKTRYKRTPSGRMTKYPVSVEDAKSRQNPVYDADELCPDCQEGPSGCPRRYVRNDRCHLCAQFDAWAFSNVLLAGQLVERQRNPERVRELVDQYGEIARTPGYSVEKEPCRWYGHIGLKTPEGRCYVCEQGEGGAVSYDRQVRDECPGTVISKEQARAAGMKIYRTGEPCKHGHRDYRYISTDGCLSCVDAPKRHPEVNGSYDRQVRRECPDMVIGKDEARAAGMRIYRTGRECKRGHRDYRYISTGHCLACMDR